MVRYNTNTHTHTSSHTPHIHQVKIGDNVLIGRGAVLGAVTVEDGARHICTHTHTHTHIFTHVTHTQVKIGDNVLIGRGALLGAVTVEDGARIGHGAIVGDGVQVRIHMLCMYVCVYACMCVQQ
jgi:acetyltransferase-like isoleucine patch superfamily enzyme